MSTLSMAIHTDNDAFGGVGPGSAELESAELGRIMQGLTDKIVNNDQPLWPGDQGRLYDINGNTVGEWLFA